MASRNAVRALEAWERQGMRCHWCRLYIPVSVPPNSYLANTLDHLERKHHIPQGPFRPAVAAHRACNMNRQYESGVSFDVVREVHRRLVSLGLEVS
jgi:hypothetical protein